MEYLQPSSFQPPQARKADEFSNNIISNSNVNFNQPKIQQFPERVASKKFVRSMPPKALTMPSPRQFTNHSSYEGGETPTPRATGNNSLYSPTSSTWRSSTASYDYGDDNDSSYESSDSEIVPLQVSNSIKKVLRSPRTPRERLSSLVIPSPSAWPTVQKLQQKNLAQQMGMAPLSAPKTPLSPAALAKLSNQFLRVPAKNETPSLDGSLTSEEVASMSCPSTPHTQNLGEDEGEWDMPVQLHPDALDTLLQLSTDFKHSELESINEVSEVSEASSVSDIPVREMESRGLDIGIAIPMTPDGGADDYEPLSAISLPSPGGFFSSLSQNAQNVWGMPHIERGPPTSIAETFYSSPWDQRSSSLPQEHVVEYTATTVGTDGPPTARRETFTVEEVDEIIVSGDDVEYEYDENYENTCHNAATSNLNRTSLWITAQETYLAALTASNPINEPNPQVELAHSPIKSLAPEQIERSAPMVSSKKSVRFANKEQQEPVDTSAKPAVSSDALVYHAFQHMVKKSHASDAYSHRHARADAIQNQRAYLPEAHRAQLLGKFNIAKPAATAPKMHLPTALNDPQAQQQREAIACAERERQALQQISLSVWNMEALKIMCGGSLLPKPATELISHVTKCGRAARILDLGGQPTADWGWAIALEHTEANVFTAMPATANSADVNWTAHRGPSNHRTVKVPNAWTLPFSSSTFDIVSVRSLHTLLHASAAAAPTRDGGDEYDATLAEIMRVLVPGGIIHYSVLDAEVSAPTSTAMSARSVEFAVSLRSRGYDPCATRHFLGKLGKTGFERVQRTWIGLSLGGQTNETMEPVSSLVGALAWEKWMLKLQMEMGRPDARLLEGLAKALDEAKRHAREHGETASWKMLVGCARKP